MSDFDLSLFFQAGPPQLHRQNFTVPVGTLGSAFIPSFGPTVSMSSVTGGAPRPSIEGQLSVASAAALVNAASSRASNDPPPPIITGDPGPRDIICGRGVDPMRYMGNMYFMDLTKAQLPHNERLLNNPDDRHRMAKSLVQQIQREGGRFMKKHPEDNNAWMEMDHPSAVLKANRRLRDLNKENKRKAKERQAIETGDTMKKTQTKSNKKYVRGKSTEQIAVEARRQLPSPKRKELEKLVKLNAFDVSSAAKLIEIPPMPVKDAATPTVGDANIVIPAPPFAASFTNRPALLTRPARSASLMDEVFTPPDLVRGTSELSDISAFEEGGHDCWPLK